MVSSKSGSTVETDSQRRAYEQAFTDAGIDPVGRIVIVTDPGSPLDESSRETGYRVVNADPDVGGRYSALTAFGLVPSGLAGADIGALLDEAEAVSDLLAEDDEANPGLRLGAAMAGTSPLRNKLVLVDQGSGLVGFADWAEQLIAESTGKQGTGVLPGRRPRRLRPRGRAAAARRDGRPARRRRRDRGRPRHARPTTAPTPGATGSDVSVTGPIGAQMLLWEVATATAGRILGINPFDQPDVESAKIAARSMLEGSPDSTPRGLHRRTRRGPRARRRLARRRLDGLRTPWPRCSARSTPSRGTSR